jgi:hypothetical protein
MEKEKESLSEGNNDARMRRVLQETSGREKGKTKGRGNRNHSRRGRETNKKTEKKRNAPGRDECRILTKYWRKKKRIRGTRMPVKK